MSDLVLVFQKKKKKGTQHRKRVGKDNETRTLWKLLLEDSATSHGNCPFLADTIQTKPHCLELVSYLLPRAPLNECCQRFFPTLLIHVPLY